jgi:hypothetical protein
MEGMHLELELMLAKDMKLIRALKALLQVLQQDQMQLL